ncbi:PREDICTED: nuclear cap-binding protein subunit 1-like [Priapulus caudatus]|uniref:Nuclear cap-binding protein subunit 1 n=1 Tax=Priapulus caudatus TaxID=37621 RepID=A0ABM1EPR0_PRICU|nr:PREDICTED: nuclear cap-binding protein subunit 1-like [Priapulus caudatus]XP_014674182.1 PREDICTED: nuclear cap-binding protein subunit 1-like [Priapulus caudatus]XP_014674183.1 PREDICTED: nuclear cap-binding protein subunit 1-like [Priapulus caudatus]
MSRRRHSSDEEEVDRKQPKRAKISEPTEIEDRLESLITRVGEKSTSSLESNLEGLAGVLEADLSNYRQKIMKILCHCAIKMPEKTTVYTTLVGLLNARNYNCGGEIVELLARNLKDALKRCVFENARTLVRFLADLVNCHVIAAGSLLQMLDDFVDVTLEDSIPQVRSDWYVYAVLSVLPWVGRELHEKKEPELERLLSTIDNYMNKRQKVHVPALRVWSSDYPHPQEEYLDCLWAQIKKLKMDRWQERTIARPYLAFDSILCEALQHNVPQVIPPPHGETCRYPYPSVVFRMFDYTDVADGPPLPGAHAIERFLIEENLHRIVRTNCQERKDCAAALVSFPDPKSKIPLNYMIVEVMLAEMFTLPQPPSIDIFYGSAFIELCKLAPSTFPQVLAQAVEILFERLDTMNMSCADRFCSWFAYHLSNFQFRWSWDEWIPCLGVDAELPKPKFIGETLIRCMRLSYHHRVREIVPESYHPLVPVKPEPVYKYEQNGASVHKGVMTAQQLMAAIKAKCTPEEALAILKTVPTPMDEDDAAYNPVKIDVFVTTLLFLGSKSFSHAFAGIAKFHYIFKALAEVEDAQIAILRSMYDVWRNHQQMMVVLVDKFLKTQIVECSAVANWLFAKDMAPDLTKFYVWEIMHSSIRRMTKQVQKLQQELEDAHEKIEAAARNKEAGLEADDDETPTDEMLERMEERLETLQSQQKNLFLIVFQRFIIILTEHLVKCEASGHDYNTPWYRYCTGRLLEVFLMHHDQVFKYISTLESLLFTSDIDLHILEVFQQFCSLRS